MPEPTDPESPRFWSTFVRARLGTEAIDADVIEEIAQHAEETYRALRMTRASDAEAVAAVTEEFADVPALVREAKAARPRRTAPPPPGPSAPGITRTAAAFLKDFVYAGRLLLNRPAFTAVALLTLALGIGANTAIFSVVHAVLLAPLPFADPDRLVMLWESDARDDTAMSIVAAPNWQDWTRQSTSFSQTAIWEDLTFNIAGGSDPEQVPGLRVSSTAFPMLGVGAQLGRTFTAEEDASGHRVVIISDALWRRRFGADPGVVGRITQLNGEAFEIIGVMPPSFAFVQRRYAIWVPIAFTAQDAAARSAFVLRRRPVETGCLVRRGES